MSDGATTLRRVIDALDSVGAKHMVVGSFASTFHGEPRTTRDIDIVVEAGAAEIARFVAALSESAESDWYADADAAQEAVTSRSMFNVIDTGTGWKVDVMIQKDSEFAKSEFSRRQAAELLGTPVFVASAEDTILSKLLWARDSESERHMRDAAGVVAAVGESLDEDYIEQWAEQLGIVDLWRQASEGSAG